MQLHLLQLGDSALPIGGYSHSWGLEAAIEAGVVRDAAGLEDWCRCWLDHALGPLEGVVVACCCRGASAQEGTANRANKCLEAGLVPSALRHASREMGEQLLALAESWPWACGAATRLAFRARPTPRDGGTHASWHHAVVFGTLAAAAGASPREALLVYLHQAVLGVIIAGVRGIPIGHTHGQQILARLHPDIERLADELHDRDLETAGSNCPAYEVFCYEQSQLYTRIFRS